MEKIERSLVVFAAIIFAALAASASPRVGHVVVISIDGGKPDVIRSSQMPVLLGLIANSSYTWKARTVTPNITLPSHTSMLTGVTPDVHKITWNDYKADKGTVKFPTIFAKAKAAGLTTALFAAKEKFRHLNVAGSLDRFALAAGSMGVAAEAAKYLVEQKPNLLFAHLPDADSTGHKFGWGSKKQKEALKTVDRAIETILQGVNDAGIVDDTVVIITADHGGTGLSHFLPIPSNYTIPWIAIGKGIEKGKNLPGGIRTIDTAATALWLLDISNAGIAGMPVTTAFKN